MRVDIDTDKTAAVLNDLVLENSMFQSQSSIVKPKASQEKDQQLKS